MYDFVVVGAGPAGSQCAYKLGSLGYSVLQIEEHRSVGKPVECTGVVSRRVISMVKTDSIVNRVHGAHIYFPSGKNVHVSKDEETIIIDRERFDQDVSSAAIGEGVELRMNSVFLDADLHDGSITVKYRKEGNIVEEKAMALVGADGAGSSVRRVLYPNQKVRRMVSAYQVEAAVKMKDQDSVDVYLGSAYSKGFFGWAAPAGDLTRIGNAGFGMSRELFLNIFKKFLDPSKLSINGGLIPIHALDRTYGERSVLVGDAGGIVKPLTGGGIYTGMLSGELAAEALNMAYEKENFSSSSLAVYQAMWKKAIGKELSRDLKIQRLYSKITDTSLNAMENLLSDPNILRKISNAGDIDFPSKVVIGILIKKPSLIKHIFFPVKEPS